MSHECTPTVYCAAKSLVTSHNVERPRVIEMEENGTGLMTVCLCRYITGQRLIRKQDKSKTYGTVEFLTEAP